MTDRLAPAGNQEMITVWKSKGTVLPPLIIYKAARHYVGWYLSLHTPEGHCGHWKFSYLEKGWTSHTLGMDWIKHFYKVTTGTVMNGA